MKTAKDLPAYDEYRTRNRRTGVVNYTAEGRRTIMRAGTEVKIMAEFISPMEGERRFITDGRRYCWCNAGDLVPSEALIYTPTEKQ